MRYEVLIMLALVGAVNLVGRVLAKRAEARSKQALDSQPRARQQGSAARSAPTVVPPEPVRVVARPVSQPAQRVPPAAPSAVNAAARSQGTAVASRSAVPTPPANPSRGPKIRNRWNARSLRRAFIASEILGSPVGLRS